MIYFYDENKRYIGLRALRQGESLPPNATTAPIELALGKEAHFIDGAWVLSNIVVVPVNPIHY